MFHAQMFTHAHTFTFREIPFFDALVLSTLKKFPCPKSVIKMNTSTVHELREIAKERGLRSYNRLRKQELIDLLNAPVRPPRSAGRRGALRKVTLIPHPADMDMFERREMERADQLKGVSSKSGMIG